MAYTRWGAIGEQAGAGLQSGLNAALQEKMKMQQIDQYAKKYNIPAQTLAMASFGVKGSGPMSVEDMLLQAIIQQQFPNYNMGASQQTSMQPQMQQPQGQPSNNGIDAIIAADGNVSPKPYKPSSGIPSDATQLQDEAGNIFYQTANGELYDANGNKVES